MGQLVQLGASRWVARCSELWLNTIGLLFDLSVFGPGAVCALSSFKVMSGHSFSVVEVAFVETFYWFYEYGFAVRVT